MLSRTAAQLVAGFAYMCTSSRVGQISGKLGAGGSLALYDASGFAFSGSMHTTIIARVRAAFVLALAAIESGRVALRRLDAGCDRPTLAIVARCMIQPRNQEDRMHLQIFPVPCFILAAFRRRNALHIHVARELGAHQFLARRQKVCSLRPRERLARERAKVCSLTRPLTHAYRDGSH